MSGIASIQRNKIQPAGLDGLPAELHAAIAWHLPRATDVVNMTCTSKSLYDSIGPKNQLLWYNIRYFWTWTRSVLEEKVKKLTDLDQNSVTLEALIPNFNNSPGEDNYQYCIDVLKGQRETQSCQICFYPWSEYIVCTETRLPGHSLFGGSESVLEEVLLYSIYKSRTFYKRACTLCISTFISKSDVQQPISSDVTSSSRTYVFWSFETVPKG